MKSSAEDKENNFCRYAILRKAGFAITPHYHHPASDKTLTQE
jgi:hypothetical protein